MMHFSKFWVLLFCSLLLFTSCTNRNTSEDAGSEAVSDADFSDEIQDTASEGSDSGSEKQAGNDEYEKDEFSEDELDEEVEPTQEKAQVEPQQEPVEPVQPEQQALAEPQPMADPTPPPAIEEPAPEPAPVAEVDAAPAPATGGAVITDIRYLANQNGGTVLIETSAPVSYQTRMNADTNQYVVEITGAELPAKLKRPYIMKDFGGAFAAVNAYQTPGTSTARVVIQLKSAGGEPVVQQEGSQLVVIPSGQQAAPVAQAAESAPAEEATPDPIENAPPDSVLGAKSLNEFLMGNNKFYGKEISIQVKDGDIRDVLNFIAEESGINMVLSEDVKGTISLKMRKVPWDQALITVMRSKKLGYVRQGSVIRISGLDSLQQENEASRRMIDSQKMVAPLRVKVIPVSYARVDELVTRIQPFLTANRGAVISDNRTSTLIVTDTDEALTKVGRLVKELDIAPAQVMIEGKIVEASETFSRTIGVNWGFTGTPLNLSPAGGYQGSPIDLRPSLGVSPIDKKVLDGSILNVGMKLGKMDILGNINATLAMAERDSLVKIISSPRIVTINKEKAEIVQKGEQITVGTIKDLNSTTKTVTRTPVVMNLTVTPQITADGGVIMDVDVRREFAGALEDQETQARAINSRTARTKILVKNAQTTVIGGIYQNDSTNSEQGVPVLKDIPVLGWLFKNKSVDTQKNELLIFLTPRILNIEDQQAKEEPPAEETPADEDSIEET